MIIFYMLTTHCANLILLVMLTIRITGDNLQTARRRLP